MDKHRDGLCWKFAVFGLLLVMGLASDFIPASGVQARLNATDGLDSEAFIAARTAAMSKLSDQQKSVLDWATSRLDQDQFRAFYGNHPTIRTFVMGEIIRAADAQRETMTALRAKIDAMDPKLVQASEEDYLIARQKRAEALKAFDAYSPTIVSTGSEPAPTGSFITVTYRLSLPAGLKLKFLPCVLEYGNERESVKSKLEFDCLFMPSDADEYRVRLRVPEGFNASHLNLKLTSEFGHAIVDQRTAEFSGIDPVEERIPEVAAFRKTQRLMKDILAQKAYF